MLKRFGVKGVKVREVVSLDEEMLVFLPSVHVPLIPWVNVHLTQTVGGPYMD